MTQYSSQTGLGEPVADTAALLSKHLQDVAYATNSALTRMLTNRETVEKVNRELGQITQNAGCRFLDMDSAYTTHCLPITKPCFLNDGVHLSTRGYQVWAKEINEHLQDLQRL